MGMVMITRARLVELLSYDVESRVRGDGGKKKRLHLGMFGTPEEAHAAYMVKATELHGAFAPQG
jgi:hypothetical protein